MNKSGFIATSLLYSFFLLFCALILVFAINIGHNSILLNKEKDKINDDIHSNKRIMHAEVGSYFRLNVCVDKDSKFNSADTMDYILFQNDDNGLGHFVAKNLSYKLNKRLLINKKEVELFYFLFDYFAYSIVLLSLIMLTLIWPG